MKSLTEHIEGIAWSQVDSNGKPAGHLENVEAIIEAFGVVVARPPLNADSFVPFFGDRFHAGAAELVRDVHTSKLHDICLRHGLDIDMRRLARHVQLIGLETEDTERLEANAARLRKGGA